MKHALLLACTTIAVGGLYSQYGGIDASFNPMDDGVYGDGVMTQHTS